jgi:hypothetical protein
LTDPGFLARFAGTYELMGLPLIVALKGERSLRVSWPGDPDYELEPIKGTEFRVKKLSGFSVEFVLDEAGTVVEALVTQPDGVFTARRTG